MARSLRSVLLLVLTTALVHAAEEEPQPPAVGEITGAGARIRGGDGITYLVIAHSEDGQRVTVRASRFGWLAIDVPASCTVWIHKSMVARAEGSKAATVAKDKVNIRARAEAKADILGQVSQGAKLRVVDEDGDWVGIAPPPQARAWIHGKFVRKVQVPGQGAGRPGRGGSPETPEDPRPHGRGSKSGYICPRVRGEVQDARRGVQTPCPRHRGIGSGGRARGGNCSGSDWRTSSWAVGSCAIAVGTTMGMPVNGPNGPMPRSARTTRAAECRERRMCLELKSIGIPFDLPCAADYNTGYM